MTGEPSRLAPQLLAVLDAMDEGVSVIDPSGRILFANEIGARMMGFDSMSDLAQASQADVSPRFHILDEHGDPFPLERMPNRLAIRGERAPPVELRYVVVKTGEEHRVILKSIPLFDAAGQVEYVVNIFRDVTGARYQTRALQLLAEAGAVLSASLDERATFQAVARATVPGLADWCVVETVDEDGGRQLMAVAHADPEQQRIAEDALRRFPRAADSPSARVLRTGQPVLIPNLSQAQQRSFAAHAELERLFASVPCETLLAIPLVARGRVLGTLTLLWAKGGRRYDPVSASLISEIGQRAAFALDNARLYQDAQDALQRIRKSEEQLRLAMDAGQMGHYEADLVTRRIVVSARLEALYGLAPGSFDGTYDGFLRVVHPEDRQYVLELIQRLMAEGRESGFVEFRVLHPGGATRWMACYNKLMRDADGRPARLLGIGFDITERREAEEKVLGLVEELRRSNAELEHFAYVASHDLQEPLRMINSYVQLLARRYQGQLDADADQFIGFAVEGVARMKRLIGDLLEYSRVSTRAREPVPVSCQQVLDRVLANLKHAAEEASAEITVDPLPVVPGDEVHFEQLFQSLIGNALKFRGREPPRIRVSVERREKEWLFSVRDNGIGIEPQYFDRIFVIFQRLHTKEEYSGTGLGLAICKKIVERYGGRIWVESTPGQGATFFFTLPVVSPVGGRGAESLASADVRTSGGSGRGPRTGLDEAG